jgi:hypothetical protein
LTKLAAFPPAVVDGAVFGPGGFLTLLCGGGALQGGYLGLGFSALVPHEAAEVLAMPAVPSAAPLHVAALVGAGFLDLSSDSGWAFSPL